MSKIRASHKQALRQLIDRFIDSAGSFKAKPVDEIIRVGDLKENLIDEILRVNDRFSSNPSLDEALNSGDGTYKP